ncbi:MAG: hypothetical protein LC135_09885 [Phycisphaerae bacterium]|jgi:hypothetical protein|nr:hypothetical protein [Phycisphaerae bacterium]MCZ2400157.1 hypothetical protein [Phycisphaerae bacterium]NUQ46714.1 hypothetical protein [Phycisphaerae bacterium]
MLIFRTSTLAATTPALVLWYFAATTLSADEPDPIGASLADARIAYELTMEDVRQDALKAIDKREVALRAKAKPNAKDLAETQEQIKTLGEERDAFVSSGDWPSIPASDDLKRRAKSARTSLLKAYERAQADYVKGKNDALAEAIQREHEQLLAESDVVPWGDNLLASSTNGHHIVGSPKQALDLGEIASGAYRIEIVAKRTQGSGALQLAVPLPDGGHACLVTPADASESRILLTLRESLLSADLGASRDANAPSEDAAANGQLALWTTGGEFRIDSVRVKRVFPASDEPDTPKEDRKQQRPTQQKQPKPELLPLNSEWTGARTFANGTAQKCTVKITRREGNKVVLRVNHDGYALAFHCTLKGDQLTLDSVFQVAGPGGSTRINPTGSGKVTANNITLRHSWRKLDNRNVMVEAVLNVSR